MKADGTMLVTCDDGSQQTVTVPKVVRDHPDQWTKAFDNGKLAWYKNDSKDSKGVPQTWVYPDGTTQEGVATPVKSAPAQTATAGAPGPVGPSGDKWDITDIWGTSPEPQTVQRPAAKVTVQASRPSATYQAAAPTYTYEAKKPAVGPTLPTLKSAAKKQALAKAVPTTSNAKLAVGIVLGVAALGLIAWMVWRE